MTTPLSKNFSSSTHRNDDYLEKKWSGKLPKYVDGIDFSNDPGKTDQSFAKDSDINNIVATYHKTGVFPEKGHELFADVSDAPTYQEAMQIVINAENAFMALDAKTRKRFDNDATQMLAFLEDPKNRSEAVALGMIPEAAPSLQPEAPVSTGGQPEALKEPVKAPKGKETP